MKWGEIKSANNLAIEAKLLNNVFYKLQTYGLTLIIQYLLIFF